MLGDFAENYSFVIQDAVQGFHWNNTQATIHPFVAYYYDAVRGEVCFLNFVIISDSLTHDKCGSSLLCKIAVNVPGHQAYCEESVLLLRWCCFPI